MWRGGVCGQKGVIQKLMKIYSCVWSSLLSSTEIASIILKQPTSCPEDERNGWLEVLCSWPVVGDMMC